MSLFSRVYLLEMLKAVIILPNLKLKFPAFSQFSSLNLIKAIYL